ncbi:MAG TPA: ABC transporter permease [Fibrobacteria bacterium]|nr:ABC transporter permease [Fibrobacteria bacterium]HOX50432.1 ABC transporter permease [Fibrobacteria bacterium]
MSGTATTSRFALALRGSLLARLSLGTLAFLYLAAILAGWIAPYGYDDESRAHSWAPPSQLRWIQGRPCVHPVSFSFDESARRVYVEDTSRAIPVRLFVNGRLFGLDSLEAISPQDGSSARLYLLGADARGRDLLSRLLYGGRISLSIGVVGVSISTFIALVVGGLAGFFGGWVDRSLMRVCEIFMLIPSFYLLMLLRATLPLDWDSRVVYLSIVLILSLIGWAGLARVIRGLVQSLRSADYIVAARALGVHPLVVLRRHALPQTFGFLAIQATLSIPGYIIAESGLSLLGLGIQDPQTSWGNLLQESMSIAEIHLHPWSLIPGLALFLAVLSYNLAGDALRDALDPRGGR